MAGLGTPRDFTELLEDWRGGNKNALDELTPALYEELRRLARHFLASERPNHTLQPTALVHEAYIRLVDQRVTDWRNRAHFLGVAATLMNAIALENVLDLAAAHEVDVLELNRSLDALSQLDPRQGKVVELRYFGGLTVEETAEVLGVSQATVKREWLTARLWLMQHMEGA